MHAVDSINYKSNSNSKSSCSYTYYVYVKSDAYVYDNYRADSKTDCAQVATYSQII